MEISANVKGYMVAKGWVAADADGPTVKGVAASKIISGELTAAKIAELDAPPATGAKALVNQAVSEAMAPITASIAELVKAMNRTAPPAPAPTPSPAPSPEQDAFKRMFAEQMAQAGIAMPGGEVTPTKLFSRNAQAAWLGAARVSKATERFDKTKSAIHWPGDSHLVALRGKRLTAPSLIGPGHGRPLDTPSMADAATVGAFFKWSLACNNSPEEYPRGLKMTDLDYELIREAAHESAWSGNVGGEEAEGAGREVNNQKLTEGMRKALLDDSTSGGITLVPQVFDDALIVAPLLFGELFPYVTVEDLTAGRRIEAATMSRPTFTSGIAESTPIPLYDTTNFIGALDTIIQNAVGAMEIGNDIQEDTPIANLGQRIIAEYGDAAKAWLDMVIAVGDGSTMPRGVFNTSGIGSVGSANDLAGPVTVGDLEGLMFGVSKAFRTSMGNNRNVYIGNETTYRRIRGIPIGNAYNGRVFGENYGDYAVMGFPYKIQTSIPNQQLGFFNLAWYKMYRRLGAQVKVSRDTGKELVLRNVTLIAVRMRYGGQLQLGGAGALMNNLEA